MIEHMCNHAGACDTSETRPLETKIGTEGIDKRHAERAKLFERLDAIDAELNEEYKRWYGRVLAELQERTKDNAIGVYFTAYSEQKMLWHNPCLIFCIETTGKPWTFRDCPARDQFDPMIKPVLEVMGFGPGWAMQGSPGNYGLFQFNPDRERNEFWRHLHNRGNFVYFDGGVRSCQEKE